MRWWKLAWVVALVGAAEVRPARGQEVLELGAAVRISGLDVPGSQVVGMFAGLVGDTVLIGIPGGSDALRVPRRAITHLEIWLGTRSNAARVAVLGMVGGTAAGAIVAILLRNRLRAEEAPGFVLGGSALGAMAGGVAGVALLRAPRWVEAPLSMLGAPADPR